MIIEVKMPKMGESITEGTILEWYKNVGEFIDLDETLLEIGTDKVDSEIPSPAKGEVLEILAKPNEVIDVGVVIARISSNSLPATDYKKSEEKDKAKNENINNSIKTTIKSSHINKNKLYSPAVSTLASEKNISSSELDLISGTGKDGRITKKDLINYIDSKSDDMKTYSSDSKLIELTHMRSIIAKRMKESIQTSAHVYIVNEVDMTDVVNYINKNKTSFFDKYDFELTFTPFITWATIKALKNIPQMNSSLIHNSIKYHSNINIGLAVSISNGLMVPTIENCENLEFKDLCTRINKIAKNTKANSISPDLLKGSTFTISNFGVFGATIGMPIINQPNVGILGCGKIEKKPVIIERNNIESIAIRSIMNLSLGFDHRVLDGSDGASFLKHIKVILEDIVNEELL